MKKKYTNPVKAIRAHCVECSGGSTSEVKDCVIEDCALYAFRMGVNPYRAKKELTEEQRAAASERLKRARKVKASTE